MQNIHSSPDGPQINASRKPAKRIRFWIALLCLAAAALACSLGRSVAPAFPNLTWVYDSKDADLQFSEPVVADGVVYLAGQSSTEGHSGRLVALDEKTGALKWDLANERLTLAAPLVAGNTVLAVERSGSQRTLLAFDAADGKPLWRGPQLRGAPQAAGELIWLISADDRLVALNRADGSQTFSRPVSSSTARSLLIAANVVYLGDPDGSLLALDATNGEPLWQAQTEPRGYYDPPVAGQGLVFLDAPLSAYDAKTGALRWSSARGTDGHTPALIGDTLYVRGFPDNETLVALDALSGAEKWSFNAPGSLTFSGMPWLAEDGSSLFVLAENNVYALDVATGALKWIFSLPRNPSPDCLVKIMTGPAVLDRVVFVNSATDKLSNRCSQTDFTAQIRLDAATGKQLGETKVEKPVFAGPEILYGLQVVDGHIFQNASGKLYVMSVK